MKKTMQKNDAAVKDLLFDGFFEGKTILVTGHTGFKGSWLALWFSALGAKVVGYSLKPPTEPNFFEAVRLQERIVHVEGDINDLDALQKVFKKYSPEIVFHLAAQPLVLESYQQPVETFETNVIGTIKVLEACRCAPSVKAVVCITTDKCYENKDVKCSFKETDRLGGYDPYSASKACAELAISAYQNSFFNHSKDKDAAFVASVRAGNVVGGGDWAKYRIVTDCVTSLAEGKKIEIRNPNATRAWQFVLEPLSGYMLLAKRLCEDGEKFEGAWNFGPDADAPVETVVRKIIGFWGSGDYTVISQAKLHEAAYLNLDSAKAKQKLKWQAVYDLDLTLGETVRWYRAFYGKQSPAALLDLSTEQIATYSQKARKVWAAEK